MTALGDRSERSPLAWSGFTIEVPEPMITQTKRQILPPIVERVDWVSALPDLSFGLPTGKFSYFEGDPVELPELPFALPTRELFGDDRWLWALDDAKKIADQYGVGEIRQFLRIAKIPESYSTHLWKLRNAWLRYRAGVIVLALMKKKVAPRWSGLIDFKSEKGFASRVNEGGGKFLDSDLKFLDLVWIWLDELDCFERAIDSLDARYYLSEPELGRGLGCCVLLKTKLQERIKKFEKGDGKKILGIDAESKEIERSLTMKASNERKRLIAETRALRRFAYRVGGLIGTRTRLASGADVYEMISGERLDRANFRRDVGGLK